MTVEANPETVTPELAALLRETVSIVCRSARRASTRAAGRARACGQPDDVRRAFYRLRDAGFDNISSISSTGSRARAPPTSSATSTEALTLEPEHLSCYELEAKPGTRFTHAHGAELERQAEAMEAYFERVVDRLTDARVPLVRDGELLPERLGRGRTRPALAAQPRRTG